MWIAIFGGKLTPLVAAFVETGKLSAADLEELEAERVRLGIPESSILPARVESDAEGNYFIGGNPDDSKSRPQTSPPLTPAEKESIKAKLAVMAKEYGELITNWEALHPAALRWASGNPSTSSMWMAAISPKMSSQTQ